MRCKPEQATSLLEPYKGFPQTPKSSLWTLHLNMFSPLPFLISFSPFPLHSILVTSGLVLFLEHSWLFPLQGLFTCYTHRL